jgi:hypothetical protein
VVDRARADRDFFTGLGQRDGKLRTIFVVGDYKQAIFRFQGPARRTFACAKRCRRRWRAAARNRGSSRLAPRRRLRRLWPRPFVPHRAAGARFRRRAIGDRHETSA